MKDIVIQENYRALARAIISDMDSKERETVICVYDTKDSGKLIAMFNNMKTCADYFNTGHKSLSSQMSRGQLRADRFKLERVIVGLIL